MSNMVVIDAQSLVIVRGGGMLRSLVASKLRNTSHRTRPRINTYKKQLNNYNKIVRDAYHIS